MTYCHVRQSASRISCTRLQYYHVIAAARARTSFTSTSEYEYFAQACGSWWLAGTCVYTSSTYVLLLCKIMQQAKSTQPRREQPARLAQGQGRSRTPV